MNKWQNGQLLLAWEFKTYSTITAGKVGKLKSCIMIIKSGNCVHVRSDVTSAVSWLRNTVGTKWISCKDSLNTTYLTIISEFSASTISSLSYIQDFSHAYPNAKSLVAASIPAPTYKPNKGQYVHADWALYPASDINATFLTHYAPFFFFFKVEASCWNLDSIHLQCERSCQVQAMIHTRKKDT